MGIEQTNSSLPQLSTPVQFLKGVGPDRAALLNKLGIRTAGELLFYFPRDYQDLTCAQSADELRPNVPASFLGEVTEIESYNSGPGRTVLAALVQAGQHIVRAVWFDQPYMERHLHRGQHLMLTGKPRLNGLRWEFVHPDIQAIQQDDWTPESLRQLLPVYRLTEGLKQPQLRRIMDALVPSLAAQVPEALPNALREEFGLVPIEQALLQIHRPDDQESLAAARRRFVVQELLVLQLALAWNRHTRGQAVPAEPLERTTRIDARIRRLFPFPLTTDQETAIREICDDMSRATAMNRLLQGDVGTGKTIVAMYAMLLAVAHGAQAVLMAPTEVLARQHYDTLSRVLALAHVRLGLLVGNTGAAERRTLLAAMAGGEVDIVIGTHAVLHPDIEFARLGLVVIDEQHKFGVQQRARLRSAGVQPHYLVMTATPIPRSIAMTEFGDLDTSALREPPPGRQPVNTYLGTEDQREQWWDFFRRKLREGRQGFVITPLLEDSENEMVTSLSTAFESLMNGPLEAFRLGLVHGRMSGDEKEEALAAFRQGDTQVIVATSIIEVGIDVPNATLMTIENAERFGLAQLHQLRGRVSRGAHPGYVCAFADARTDDALERLTAFQQTTDGFELAEIDYRLRGPGEVLGTKQHGLPPFRVADLERDQGELETTQGIARRLVEEEDFVNGEVWNRLRQLVVNRYGSALGLSDVG